MGDQHATVTEQWVQRWKQLAPLLDELGKPPADTAPLRKVLPQFNDSFRSALALHPPEPWSGLIEQQAAFRGSRH